MIHEWSMTVDEFSWSSYIHKTSAKFQRASCMTLKTSCCLAMSPFKTETSASFWTSTAEVSSICG